MDEKIDLKDLVINQSFLIFEGWELDGYFSDRLVAEIRALFDILKFIIKNKINIFNNKF